MIFVTDHHKWPRSVKCNMNNAFFAFPNNIHIYYIYTIAFIPIFPDIMLKITKYDGCCVNGRRQQWMKQSISEVCTREQ